MKLDSTIESSNKGAALSFFANDCEIELPDVQLLAWASTVTPE